MGSPIAPQLLLTSNLCCPHPAPCPPAFTACPAAGGWSSSLREHRALRPPLVLLMGLTTAPHPQHLDLLRLWYGYRPLQWKWRVQAGGVGVDFICTYSHESHANTRWQELVQQNLKVNSDGIKKCAPNLCFYVQMNVPAIILQLCLKYGFYSKPFDEINKLKVLGVLIRSGVKKTASARIKCQNTQDEYQHQYW